jgi:L,D-peptidoglycan transpeptidase YkuD (ErfK/YbiS/YcfS/YnhG family)
MWQMAIFSLATALGVLLSPSLSVTSAASSSGCPADLAAATRLILITAESITSFRAKMQAFERQRPGEPWKVRGLESDAVIGRNGLAWGYPFRRRATSPQSIKVEGDGRTPAGLYRLGRPFGFEPEPLPGFLRLELGETFCVDDPSSPHYNTIVPRNTLPQNATGEDMRDVALYRHGLIVEYPSDAKTKAGSCIFLHIWRSPSSGTAGCVAAPESVIIDLQQWARGSKPWIAVYADEDANRLRDCLKRDSGSK